MNARLSGLSVVLLGVLAVGLNTGGCVWPGGGQIEIPTEIAAIIADRAAVQVDENDPRFSATPGLVGDPLTGLDGCFASYVAYSTPAEIAALFPGVGPLDTYTLMRFDASTGTMSLSIYGEIQGTQVANLAAYDGTYVLIGDNMVRFTVGDFMVTDSLSNQTFNYPEDLPALIDQLVEEENLTAEQEAELRASLEEAFVFDYLATLDGDQLILVDHWTWEDDQGQTQEENGEVDVLLRVDCP